MFVVLLPVFSEIIGHLVPRQLAVCVVNDVIAVVKNSVVVGILTDAVKSEQIVVIKPLGVDKNVLREITEH